MARAKRKTRKAKAKTGALHLVRMSGFGKKVNTRYGKKVKKGVYLYVIKGR